MALPGALPHLGVDNRRSTWAPPYENVYQRIAGAGGGCQFPIQSVISWRNYTECSTPEHQKSCRAGPACPAAGEWDDSQRTAHRGCCPRRSASPESGFFLAVSLRGAKRRGNPYSPVPDMQGHPGRGRVVRPLAPPLGELSAQPTDTKTC